ncbi:MAG: TonB-dependent receptor [Chromatiales bacterium]|nr:MAG: TonB-dependent receptor [Chromatiales bacterium]
MTTRHNMYGWSLLALSLALGGPLPVSGQSLIDEIIVTSQRREEQLQDVPIAVTAYSADQLEVLQVHETLDIGRLVPNLIAHNNTGLGTANAYSLRGLNNTESIATFDPPVGSYVDDIYVSRQNANNFTLFDVDRIEVLRGPQGTLFGRNTTGGAVRVILKKPAEELGGYIEGGVGGYDHYNARGSVDIPISDTFLTKLSGYWIDEDGYVDNPTTGDTLNGEENFGIRGAALWRIADGLAWDVAIDYTDTDEVNLTNNRSGSSRISLTGLTQDGTPLAGLLTGEKQNYGLGNEVEAFSVTSNLEWDMALGTVSFITGWRDMTQKFALDFLNSPVSYGGFTIANDGEHEQFTQEIKLAGDVGDRVQYVAGIYYLDEDNSTDFGDIFDLGFPLVLADRVLDNTSEAWAVYLQSDIEVADRWTVTLGVRYTDEDKDVSFTDNQPKAFCTPFAPPACSYQDVNGDNIADDDLSNVNLDNLNAINPSFANIQRTQNEQLWTPRIAVQYAATDELNFYGSATRGFKSGGWNARGTTPDQLQPFGPEIVWSYEAGMRSEWLDNRLRVNLTAFYADVSDFQLPTAFETTSGAIQFITKNFADLENKGLELEVIAKPIDSLTLLANIGLQDGEYTNLGQEILDQQALCLGGATASCNQGIVTADGSIAEPTRTPDSTATIGFIYDIKIGSSFEISPSAYLYSLGDHSVFSTGAPQFQVDGYTTYNASVALRNVEQDWSLTLGCRNCNDRTMLVSGLANQPYYQDPRTWSVLFHKGFGGS